MTYIDYMNRFWRMAEYESFSASEVALYVFLVNECNKIHWQMPFSCPTCHICNQLRISKQTLVTAREKLAKRKLISYTNGTARFQPSRYSLLGLTEDLTVHLTEDLTYNKDIDKDKEIKSQYAHDTESLLPVEKLEGILVSDTEWLGKVKEYLCAGGMDVSSADMLPLLERFCCYLRASGISRKTEEDTRRHFVNWICRQRQGSQSAEKRKAMRHTGLVLSDDSLDRYKPFED